jgi:Arc/MetJ family transcription regulator
MRTNVEIDETLMRKAMRSTRTRTKRATVEAGLRLLIQTWGQTSVRRLRGKIRWEGTRASRVLGRVAE